MKYQTFLIKTDNDKEAVMRLPINRYGSFTPKAIKTIRERFYDGSERKYDNWRYVINLEAYSNGHDISKAIEKYYQNKI